jgi:hypothetical protein
MDDYKRWLEAGKKIRKDIAESLHKQKSEVEEGCNGFALGALDFAIACYLEVGIPLEILIDDITRIYKDGPATIGFREMKRGCN